MLYNIWQELATFKSLVCYYTGSEGSITKSVNQRNPRGPTPHVEATDEPPDAGDNCVLVLLDRRGS